MECAASRREQPRAATRRTRVASDGAPPSPAAPCRRGRSPRREERRTPGVMGTEEKRGWRGGDRHERRAGNPRRRLEMGARAERSRYG
eukprot:6186258-Pleurochrysis_carterae.AAC.1